MGLFLSKFVNKLDKKGRVSVPASFRAALEESGFPGIVVFPSYKFSVIEACGMDRMERIAKSLDRLDLFSDEQDDLATTVLADAQQLAFDPEGRITLPQDLAAHAVIADTAMFVGKGATFQIWAPETFKVQQAHALERARRQRPTLSLIPEDKENKDER
ncbi:MAG: division/cell wall cluster transcriptional repressor MraZ [Proteobacteria bacterium]|nr:division/cell wall cluster transcriptional repressor MraZ [Pseudomonadota bacterium]MBI3496589.1 division/cell wall cluster transcriptional repressor MraZ [Pseudomonadota bacterium]